MKDINTIISNILNESGFMNERAKKEHAKAIKTGRIFFDIQKINSDSKDEYHERTNS